MPVDPVPFLLLSGPPGVGKTTVAWEIYEQVVGEGRAALVDLDLIGVCGPAPDDDPYNETLKALNLKAMWQNYREAGTLCLIAAVVIESRDGLAAYVDAVSGAVPTLCRLAAKRDELRRRIVARGRERGTTLRSSIAARSNCPRSWKRAIARTSGWIPTIAASRTWPSW